VLDEHARSCRLARRRSARPLRSTDRRRQTLGARDAAVARGPTRALGFALERAETTAWGRRHALEHENSPVYTALRARGAILLPWLSPPSWCRTRAPRFLPTTSSCSLERRGPITSVCW